MIRDRSRGFPMTSDDALAGRAGDRRPGGSPAGRPVRLVVVGDVLLDEELIGHVERVSREAPVPVVANPQRLRRPGGAGLAALLAAAEGHEVTVLTALAGDEAGEQALADLRAAG